MKLKPLKLRVLCEPPISHSCYSDRAAFNTLDAESLQSTFFFFFFLTEISLAFLFSVWEIVSVKISYRLLQSHAWNNGPCGK